MMGGMDLGLLLAAHADLQVERPPVLWTADIGDAALGRMLGEMIAAGLQRGNERRDLVLRVNNVTVSADPDEEMTVPAPGDYVALSILGGGDWRPETLAAASARDAGPRDRRARPGGSGGRDPLCVHEIGWRRRVGHCVPPRRSPASRLHAGPA